MRFTDFLKATVLMSAGAATALAAVTVVGANADGDYTVVLVGLGWWTAAAALGAWIGRRAETNPPIARLLADARFSPALPDVQPGRILLNRLWPLLLAMVGSGAVAFVTPQVPAIAAGFSLILALYWRRQDAAVTAVEDRDGAQFWVDRTSPFTPIRLVRTPGLRRIGPPSADGLG